MRKYLIVAAAAGGFLLLGGGPAYADHNPAPAGPLGGLLDPAGGGINLDNPVDGNPIIKVKPGSNTPTLPALPTAPGRPASGLPGSGLPGSAATPTEDGLPAARTGLGGAEPAADVVGGTPLGSIDDDTFAVAEVPVGRLLSDGGVPGLGLMPDGSAPLAPAVPANREAGLLGGGVPLLGGLGGLLPEPDRTLPADGPDTSGMPAGGTAVGTPGQPAPDEPATDEPATADPDPSGPGDDKQLHEEPIDDEAGGRSFSSGRPVAGEDPDFK